MLCAQTQRLEKRCFVQSQKDDWVVHVLNFFFCVTKLKTFSLSRLSRPNSFVIITAHRVLHCMAESAEEMHHWITLLQRTKGDTRVQGQEFIIRGENSKTTLTFYSFVEWLKHLSELDNSVIINYFFNIPFVVMIAYDSFTSGFQAGCIKRSAAAVVGILNWRSAGLCWLIILWIIIRAQRGTPWNWALWCLIACVLWSSRTRESSKRPVSTQTTHMHETIPVKQRHVYGC